MRSARLTTLLTSHLVVALIALVGIGGATRVMEAGLACPDWPLCYGTFLPGRQMNLQVFLEWFHRLDAFLVGLALVALQVVVLRRPAGRRPVWLIAASAAALGLVAVQGLLGALTVTQLLRFDVVTAHLSTALVLVALVSAIHQGLADCELLAPSSMAQPAAARARFAEPIVASPLAWLGRNGWWLASAITALAVFIQAVSGALMATQWASGSCLRSGVACGWLALHRQLATPVAASVLVLAAAHLLVSRKRSRQGPYALAALLLVCLQIALGVLTLRLSLAVPLVTVAHQLTAALLVAVLSALAMLHRPIPSSEAITSVQPQNARLESCHG
ncbi:COX15/CtaA family protein [Synechococcus sp. Cruz-9H2]|uniref:COX15/CtaA family protein n=1 Tax=unclassified Synechococcus TaxID=2626047 RepID=UPI0020CC977C|nr:MULTISPECIES: COX15/CtaA family protein [unclassified Synechococcus]MCP9818707.1 COX15/CtaA family protein [Synechococcus sp. Cruz-9H2]MCP9842937.1 COX15/CtaA family protein [Synechococcus sp. Edmonson 11F2]MCP9855962.1 COX15/CtaA family protein [Synechococcus sp. Cruz-9C9]MCP9862151.1 COX15/CtaA family protein [Synechococcus sp. Cruz-7E5]MCP9869422.1 COX15/CtaA family protein [Synechococcus sp. Cruz-7B9]